MSPMEFVAKQGLSQRWIDLSSLVPNTLMDRTVNEIAKMTLATSNGTVPLGEIFSICDGHRDEILVRGLTRKFCHVGGQLKSGRMLVDGSVGDNLANGMTGGQLTLTGDAGDYAFSGMSGGTAVVKGSCGEHAASSVDPMATGMLGGVAVVEGNCGKWAANRMRRGTLVVHGNLAAGAAARMIAGTIVVCGAIDEPLGAGMRRGTIVVISNECSPCRYAGFTQPENTELSFLPLLLKSVAPKLPENCVPRITRVAMRSIGDRTTNGLAELIWLAEPEATEAHVPVA